MCIPCREGSPFSQAIYLQLHLVSILLDFSYTLEDVGSRCSTPKAIPRQSCFKRLLHFVLDSHLASCQLQYFLYKRHDFIVLNQESAQVHALKNSCGVFLGRVNVETPHLLSA